MEGDETIDYGGRLFWRPVRANYADGLLIARWRNSPLARAGFYSTRVVTPDSHIAFMHHKDPYDLLWMICLCESGKEIGMVAMKIDADHHTGEYGRLYIDPNCNGNGFATETDYMVLATGFELFQLDMVWLDAYLDNLPIMHIHDKTGWKTGGIDLMNHTDPRGPVKHMTYDRAMWAERRAVFYDGKLIAMPDWTP